MTARVLTPEQVVEVRSLAGEGLGQRRIAAQLGVSRWLVRRELEGGGPGGRAERASVTVAGDTAAVVLPPGVSFGELEQMLQDRGLVPADWHVERVTVNEWDALVGGGKVTTLQQLKAQLRNRRSVVGPAVEVERRHVPARGASLAAGELAAVIGDHQAPYHDPELHAAVLRWLADVSPAHVILAGDTMDLPTISRHPDRPRWNASVQECVNAAYAVISDYRDAVPHARMVKLRGNHDWRLESELMGRAERMAFIRPADRGEPEPHLYSVRRMLHLDELAVELAGQEGDDWRFGEATVAPGVVVRHEPPSAAKLARLNRSVVAGHTHRQSVRHVTTFGPDGEPVVRTLVEAGGMMLARGGLGYATDPDWQQGFATVALHAGGTAHFELASWRAGALTWRGERWHGR